MWACDKCERIVQQGHARHIRLEVDGVKLHLHYKCLKQMQKDPCAPMLLSALADKYRDYPYRHVLRKRWRLCPGYYPSSLQDIRDDAAMGMRVKYREDHPLWYLDDDDDEVTELPSMPRAG